MISCLMSVTVYLSRACRPLSRALSDELLHNNFAGSNKELDLGLHGRDDAAQGMEDTIFGGRLVRDRGAVELTGLLENAGKLVGIAQDLGCCCPHCWCS